MRTNKFFKIFTLLAIPVLFYLVLSGFNGGTGTTAGTQTPPVITNGGKDFFNFILNSAYNPDYPNCCNVENYLSSGYYRELNFTGVHMYDVPEGTDYYG